MLQAFMLVTVAMGAADSTAAALRLIDGVTSADVVTGPYDIVVDMAALDVDVLGVLVQDKVQRVPGVVRTLTCPVFHL
ncbi:MAG: Lrp/AsnC ligand binding domain-containing protein [Mycobacteriales bacterium]